MGGINVATEAFLQTIRKVCDTYGSVYIADGVQCGYGRSGNFFSHDYAGVDADIYSVAKGMGNGFHFAGNLIAPHFEAKMGMQGTTFGGNHLASAAGLAVLEVIESERLIHNATKMCNYLMAQLSTIPEVENVRGLGLMIGFDVPENIKGLKQQLYQQYKILTGAAGENVIRLLPSLAIDQPIVDKFIGALKNAIVDLKK